MAKSILYKVLHESSLPMLYLTPNTVTRASVPVGGVISPGTVTSIGCAARVEPIELDQVKISWRDEIYFLTLGDKVQWLPEKEI